MPVNPSRKAMIFLVRRCKCARICDIAQADAILVSREIRDACTSVDLEFAPAGSETLKGFSEPVPLFSPAY